MKRFVLFALIAGLALAAVGLSPANAATTAFQGQARGRGHCLMANNHQMLCRFGGLFGGKLDGVRRHGQWRLSFRVEFQFASTAAKGGGEVAMEEISYVMRTAPTQSLPGFTIVSPRDPASGLPTGKLVSNTDGGFDMTLASPMVGGGKTFDLTAEAVITAGTPLAIESMKIEYEG